MAEGEKSATKSGSLSGHYNSQVIAMGKRSTNGPGPMTKAGYISRLSYGYWSGKSKAVLRRGGSSGSPYGVSIADDPERVFYPKRIRQQSEPGFIGGLLDLLRDPAVRWQLVCKTTGRKKAT